LKKRTKKLFLIGTEPGIGRRASHGRRTRHNLWGNRPNRSGNFSRGRALCHGTFCTVSFTMRTLSSASLTLILLLAAMPLLSACHTTAGAGEDISATGHAIDNAATKATP